MKLLLKLQIDGMWETPEFEMEMPDEYAVHIMGRWTETRTRMIPYTPHHLANVIIRKEKQ